MITGELINKIDSLWEIFWTGGLTNPLDGIYEQLAKLSDTDARGAYTNTCSPSCPPLG